MTAPLPPRTWLYVPGHAARKLERARTAGSDAVILDLEDAVPAAEKDAARVRVAAALAAGGFGGAARWVRIHPPLAGDAWREDLAALAGQPPDGLVLPKVSRPAQVEAVREACAGWPRDGAAPVPLAPIVTEDPAGALALSRTVTPGLAAAFWGTEDLASEVGARRVRAPDGELLDVFRVVRGLFLLTTAAAGVPAVDTPFLRLDDPEGLAAEARQAFWSGFAGKQVIHPAHVPVVNEAFTPTGEELATAAAVVAAAERAGGGALAVDGSMVDPPHLRAARALLARGGTEVGS